MLDSFKEQFDNSYETVYQKVSVAIGSAATTRFENTLSFGQTLKRVLPDLSGVRVRTNVNGTDNTIDSLTDTDETLTVNIDKTANFSLPDTHKVQAGPLKPGMWFGKEIAQKGAIYMDAQILSETVNASQTFDTGDLTTESSNGTPITLSTTNAPQLVAQSVAKISVIDVIPQNTVWVVDPYSLSVMHQYLLGKNIDMAGRLFENGYTGANVGGAQVYVTNNLTGTAVITYTGQPSNGETIAIKARGSTITFTAVSSIGSTAGNFLIGGDADTTYANLTALINAPGTTNANQVALSAANQIVVTDLWGATAAQDTTANTVTITGVGSSRFTVTDGLSNATVSSYVNSYLGVRGGIDYVAQNVVEYEVKRHPFQPADIYSFHWLGGKKTYTDGSKKFLNVKIA